jgi:hypothetical protein
VPIAGDYYNSLSLSLSKKFMKKYLIAFLGAFLVVGMFSCSEDFEVAAPYKKITIVYGLLDMHDTAHYIRIQKAFLDEHKSVIEMAKVPDSNFYPESELNVYIREIKNGAILNNLTLKRVDMNLEGYPKDSGIFFKTPNYAYKFKMPLSPLNSGIRYRLVISNVVSGVVDSAEISVVDSNAINSPTIFNKNSWDFSKTAPKGIKNSTVFAPLFILPYSPIYMEGNVTFHWVDSNLSTAVQKDSAASFTFDSRPVTLLNPELLADNINFYNFLRDAMGTPAPDVVRLMDSVEFTIYAAGSEFYDYILNNQIANGGLTSDQIKPTYTNILGPNVFGLFSSRAHRTMRNVGLTQTTIDSLKVSSLTSPAKIVGQSHH